MDNKKINPIELMLELNSSVSENYKSLSILNISTYGEFADITLVSSYTGQKIKISVSVEDSPEAQNE